MSCGQNEVPRSAQSTSAQTAALEKRIAEQHVKIVELTKQNGTLDLSVRAFTDRLHSFNQVLDRRDKEIEARNRKIKALEGTLRAKTLELQDMQENVTGHKSRIQLLQDELFFEKSASRALRERLEKAERRQQGRPEPELTPEVRRHRLMQELQQIAEVYGEDSEAYKVKQKRLDRMLRAESSNPETKDK